MRLALTLVFACSIALSLAACAPADHVLQPDQSSATPEPAPDSTLDPSADPVNETVGINCQTLVSDQVIYDWGSGNFALDDGYSPEAGSSAAQIAADGGLACRWINLTSQETLDVAVSIPAEADLATAQQTAAATGTPTPEFGDAYFRSADGVGYLEIFSDGYWLTLQSTWIYAASDATPLVDAAIAALPPLD